MFKHVLNTYEALDLICSTSKSLKKAYVFGSISTFWSPSSVAFKLEQLMPFEEGWVGQLLASLIILVYV